MKKKNPKREKLAKALTGEVAEKAPEYKPSLRIEKKFLEGSEVDVDDKVTLTVEARVSGIQHDDFDNSVSFEISKASVDKE